MLAMLANIGMIDTGKDEYGTWLAIQIQNN
jgi:hypothetical protein